MPLCYRERKLCPSGGCDCESLAKQEINCNVCGEPLPHERCDTEKAGDGHIKGPYVETLENSWEVKGNPWPVLIRAQKALDLIQELIASAKEDTGDQCRATLRKIERICKEGLGE